MSKRGISRASMRVRLAVAAAVLAGGGAAGVVAVSASHSGLPAAESAGYYQTSGRTLSYTSALSAAVKGWSKSPSTSLTTISHMKPVTNYWTQAWHRAIIFIQRGTVVAVGKGEFAVKSANGTIEIWHVNRGTKTQNVGGTSTGLSAMTGGTTKLPSLWKMNTKVTGIAKGDLVFVFGERENHTLKAQLVLFAAPTATTKPMATPTATTKPMATPTATTPMATPTATATATSTATAPAMTPTGTASTFSGNNS
jgi:cell division septation protein DedD